MTLVQPIVAIDRKGTGTVELTCPDIAPVCSGSATITMGKPRKRRRPLGTLAIDGSGTLDLPLALTRHGRSLVRHKKNLKATLTIAAVDADGNDVGATAACRLVWSGNLPR
jgi:hypothetical protein